ncbi:hypothetical protein A3L09_08315 [Thermococcus profundus]|uniref:Uncharacterized protein n=1 Tax=Thermococcus profundus TaxID=49899 RepID=A0A2Z2MA65_THEPR|nr:hypothetical protein [Thermococcus profundus]ASJ03257.1 hypothetical protein A3L09_08315 [Thermococcus profundus]
MRVGIPYVLFETRTGRYGLDAYFFTRLERVEHRAVLIRKADGLTSAPEFSGGLDVAPENVSVLLKELALSLYEMSGRRFEERKKHMRRWNIFRFLGIPTGYLKHLQKDEELAKRNREALLALSIVEHVLGIKKPADLEKAEVTPLGWGIFELEMDDEPLDSVYRELYKTDEGFRRALWGLVNNEKK